VGLVGPDVNWGEAVKSVNVAVLGFGNHFTRHHLPHVVANPSVNISAVVEVLPKDKAEVASRLAESGLNAAIYETLDEFTEPEDTRCLEAWLDKHAERLSAAFISTPHTRHYYEARACLNAGLHVFVDKPLAVKYAHARELNRIARDNNLELVVGSQRRYERVFDFAKQTVQNGELGRLIQITGIMSAPHDHFTGWWADPKWAGPGPVLWNLAWHLVDVIVYLTNGRATTVDGILDTPKNGKGEAFASALIRFDSDVAVTLAVNVGGPRDSVYERIQIWGSGGMLSLDRFKPKHDRQPAVVTLQRINGELADCHLSDAVPLAWAPVDAFIGVLTADAKGKDETRRALVSRGEDSLRTVRILEEIYRSHQLR
jgi:predicted dehydrogenase